MTGKGEPFVVINDGGPAFPFLDRSYPASQHLGMSLRDYFAAAALPTVLEWQRRASVASWTEFIANSSDVNTVKSAYEIADAMLEARKR